MSLAASPSAGRSPPVAATLALLFCAIEGDSFRVADVRAARIQVFTELV